MARSDDNTVISQHSGWLATGLVIGLIGLGALLRMAALEYKSFERTVNVKGLAEREYPADVVIWPIQFTAADNDLARLYATVDESTNRIRAFLMERGIGAEEISSSSPAITDKSAQSYGGGSPAPFRYSAVQTVTVYSGNVDTVRAAMPSLSDLGRTGIVFSGDQYQTQVEYVFTRLNEIKPDMVEEATRNAREVAEKFAEDSESRLGKIKRASQGQFSIYARDRNNPQIKKVRVVSTVEYYLAD
ncbi:MAG: SIMPL domain-containing protein [Pseudomonadota bacterium]